MPLHGQPVFLILVLPVYTGKKITRLTGEKLKSARYVRCYMRSLDDSLNDGLLS